MKDGKHVKLSVYNEKETHNVNMESLYVKKY